MSSLQDKELTKSFFGCPSCHTDYDKDVFGYIYCPYDGAILEMVTEDV